jgi:TolB-like protein
VTAALTARLARLPGVRVAERGAAAAAASGERRTDPRHVGRTLAVALLLDGSVRRAGPRVRVTARLTSAKESVVVWSDTFEADGAELHAVEDRIARGLADALRITLAADTQGAGR